MERSQLKMLRNLADTARSAGHAWVDDRSAIGLIIDSARSGQIACGQCRAQLIDADAIERVRAGLLATCGQCGAKINWRTGTPWARTPVKPWQAVLMAFAASTCGLTPDVQEIFGMAPNTLRRWRRLYESALEENR